MPIHFFRYRVHICKLRCRKTNLYLTRKTETVKFRAVAMVCTLYCTSGFLDRYFTVYDWCLGQILYVYVNKNRTYIVASAPTRDRDSDYLGGQCKTSHTSNMNTFCPKILFFKRFSSILYTVDISWNLGLITQPRCQDFAD